MLLKDFVPERPVLFGAAALLSGLFYYYYVFIYHDFLLGTDDIAFIGSLDSPAEWFTQGYSNYFDVYPEWGSASNTDLLKPVTNIVAYLSQALFGEHYALHFALFFLMQCCALLIFLRLLREAAVPTLPAAFMGLLFLTNPAFVNVGLWCLACQFDVLAGLFALIAFFALWRRRNVLALVFITLAIFTKETAAFAPIAAALSVVIWNRDRKIAISMLMPLLLWAGARLFAYGDVLNERVGDPLSSVALGLLFWPTGVTDAGLIERLGSVIALNPHNLISVAFVIANVALWVFILYATVITARERLLQHSRFGEKLTPAILIWMLGALSIGVLAAHQSRYGGSYYAFLYMFLGIFLFSTENYVPRWIAASVVLVFAAGTAWHAQENSRLATTWSAREAPSRALHDALRGLPQDGRLVYVINAPRTFVPSMRYLNRSWSLNLDVVVINHFQRCERATDAGATQFAGFGGDTISIRIPDCALFDFFQVSPDLLQRGITGSLVRTGVGTYQFPDGVVSSEVHADLDHLGHTLQFQIDAQRSPTVIAYDWAAIRYSVIPPP